MTGCPRCQWTGEVRDIAGYGKRSTDDPREIGIPIYGLIYPCPACAADPQEAK